MESYQEFTIERRKEQFRIGYISPIELLSIGTQIDFDHLEKTQALMTFVFEHVEVKIMESWSPVKMKGKEVWLPIGIEKDLLALNEIFDYVMKEIIGVVFPNSEG